MAWRGINPEDYRKSDESLIYKSTILQHFARIIAIGTDAVGRADHIRFCHAIQMLEGAIGHRISKEYQNEIGKLMAIGQKQIDNGDLNGYWNVLLTRFMLITQEMSFLGYMPEERAVDVIGGKELEGENEDTIAGPEHEKLPYPKG